MCISYHGKDWSLYWHMLSEVKTVSLIFLKPVLHPLTNPASQSLYHYWGTLGQVLSEKHVRHKGNLFPQLLCLFISFSYPYYRIIEFLSWKGLLKVIEYNSLAMNTAGTPAPISGCSEPCPAWPWVSLSATSLDNLFQCLTTLTAKNLLLISNLNCLSFSLKPFPLVLSQQTLLKSLFPSFP